MDVWKRRLILALFAIAGPVFLAGSTREYLRARDVASFGVAGTATILDAQLEQGHRGADRYRLELEFPGQDANAPARSAVLYVSPKEYRKIDGLDQVAIRYLPDDPARVMLAGGASNAWMGAAVGLVMTAIGWGSLVKHLRGRGKE